MTGKRLVVAPPSPHKSDTPAFKAAGAHEATAVALPPTWPMPEPHARPVGHWQRKFREQTGSNAEREEVKRLRTKWQRAETERDILEVYPG